MLEKDLESRNRQFTCIWGCGICIAVCGDNAISCESDAFEINLQACSRCLLCVRACPAGVIGENLFE